MKSLSKKLAATLAIALIVLASAFIAQAQADQTNTEVVLNHHLQSFGGGDMDGVLSDYTESSVIITPMGVLKGKKQIKGMFTALFAEFGKPGVKFNMTHSTIVDEVAYITWNADTPDNVYTFASDTLVVIAGKIAYQTIALQVQPK